MKPLIISILVFLSLRILAQQSFPLHQPYMGAKNTNTQEIETRSSEKDLKDISRIKYSKSGLSNGSYVIDSGYYQFSNYIYNIKGADIIELDSFLYLNGDYRDWYPSAPHPTNWKLYTMKLNKHGETIWTRTDSLGQRDNHRTYMRNIIRLADNNILTMGEYVDWDTTQPWLPEKTSLIKIDTAGNLIWSKLVGLPDSLGGFLWSVDIVAEPDSGFTTQAYTLSETRHWAYDSSQIEPDTVFISIVRFDKMGNIVKMNRFQVGTELIEVMASGIVKTPDGGYVLAGHNVFENDSNYSITYNRKSFLIGLDSLFQLHWIKIFDQSVLFSIFKTNISLADKEDGILFATTTANDSFPVYNGRIHFGKIDFEGNTIWEKWYYKVLESNYGPPGWYVVSGASMGIVEAKNGDIVIASQVSGYNGAHLYCTDSMGNEKWNRWVPYWGEFLYNLRNAEDNGFLLTGVSSGAWLVKTDSIGCVMPNCIDTMMHIGIEEFEIMQKQQLIVYPNPAQDQVQFAINIQGEKIEAFEIYDNSGRLIAQQKSDSYLVSFSVVDLPQGMYIVKIISNNQKQFVGKFVKE